MQKPLKRHLLANIVWTSNMTSDFSRNRTPHQVRALIVCLFSPSSRIGLGNLKTVRRVLATSAKLAIGLSICLANHTPYLSLLSDAVRFLTYFHDTL